MVTPINILLTARMAGTLTESQAIELEALLQDVAQAAAVKDEIQLALEEPVAPDLVLDPESGQAIIRAILPGKIAPVRRLNWKRWAVAASLLVLLGFAGFLYWSPQHSTKKVARTQTQTDVEAPHQQRAVITLADGSKIYLDSLTPGVLAAQQDIEIIRNKDGKISYRALAPTAVTEVVYNTLENPRGSPVIDMTLVDGSRVWLNAGSSITYPVSFAGTNRTITMNGEAYFEVAHDAKHPFVVSKGSTQVTVLGTHFNVNAYDDEADIKVTLLEGSVSINETKIKPGQQAIVGGQISIKEGIDLDAVMAWKNGLFSFESASLPTVMRELARWYNIEVKYEGKVSERRFNGEIGRSLTLDQVLKVLSRTRINYKIEGTTLTIQP